MRVLQTARMARLLGFLVAAAAAERRNGAAAAERRSKDAERRNGTAYVFSHHKNGHYLSHRFAARARRLAPSAPVVYGGTWFGQGFEEDADWSAFDRWDAYLTHRCLNCFGGTLARRDRAVNVVRDPFAAVASGYASPRPSGDLVGLGWFFNGTTLVV